MAAGAGDDDAVQRGVDLAVAALVEALSLRVAGAGGDRRDPGGARELGGGGEALRAGDLADQLGSGEWSEARLGEQLRRELADELGDLSLECLIVRERSRMRRSSSRAMRTRIVCSARARRRATRGAQRP